MEQSQIKESKKRSIRDITTHDLAFKFKSKQDFLVYFDKQ